MEINNLRNIPFCDLRVGMIYYFYQDPQKHKREIKDLFNSFCSLTNPKFLYYRHNKSVGLSKLETDGSDYFNKMVEETDFNETQHLLLTDSTKESLHDVRIEMMLRTIREEYISKTPNWIYFEFKPTIPYDEVLNFIKQSFYNITYHYSCCNYVIGYNDHWLPKSASKAIKLLKQTQIITDSYSVLLNPFFLKKVESEVDGANLIQVLSKKIYEKIGFKTIIEKSNNGYFTHEFGEDYVLLKLSVNEFPDSETNFFDKYKAISDLLTPVIADIKKPQMYWKQEDWEKWRKRFG